MRTPDHRPLCIGRAGSTRYSRTLHRRRVVSGAFSFGGE